MSDNRRQAVFTVINRGEGMRPFWLRIGSGYVCKDGSVNVKLDALPVNGMINIRPEQPREKKEDTSFNPPFDNKNPAGLPEPDPNDYGF